MLVTFSLLVSSRVLKWLYFLIMFVFSFLRYCLIFSVFMHWFANYPHYEKNSSFKVSDVSLVAFDYISQSSPAINAHWFIICCHVTNSRDNTERLLLMKTVTYSRKVQDLNLRLEFIFSSLITKVKNEHSWNYP